MTYRGVFCAVILSAGLLFCAPVWAAGSTPQPESAASLRIAVLKFGTVNWVMDVIKHHKLDRAEGFELEVQAYAGKQAAAVAFQAKSADLAVNDWFWVSRQRSLGRKVSFVPYSTAAGSLVVPKGSSIKGVEDLPGKRLGIAGGPLDKNWLLMRFWARSDKSIDLDKALEKVFAAPPLLAKQVEIGGVDAAVLFWPYVARLQAKGMNRLIAMEKILANVGIKSRIPLVGYIFREEDDKVKKGTMAAFFRAVRKAEIILKDQDAEWARIRPLLRAGDNETFAALRQGFRSGILEAWGETERKDAKKLYRILATVGGERLVGKAPAMAEGTFWPQVVY
jgi:NitT/TauT family transport system substrate-binding protein